MLKRPTFFKRLDRLGIWIAVVTGILGVLTAIWGFSDSWHDKVPKSEFEPVKESVTKHGERLDAQGHTIDGMAQDVRDIRQNQELFMRSYGVQPIPRPTVPHKG